MTGPNAANANPTIYSVSLMNRQTLKDRRTVHAVSHSDVNHTVCGLDLIRKSATVNWQPINCGTCLTALAP